jgi:hypothetical protein
MSLEGKVIRVLETKEGTTTIYENGFIESKIKDDALLDVDYLVEGKKLVEESLPGKKVLVITHSEGFYRITKEAKMLSASAGYSNHIAAVAVLTTHVALKFVLDFYLKINKPVVPTKGFTEKDTAIKWLQEHNYSAAS